MKKRNIAMKFGVFTAVILIVYFLFLGLIGINSNPVYSFVNAAICAVGISLAIRSLQEQNQEGVNYFDGFKTGFFTGAIATIIFTIFFITYYSYDQQFATALQKEIGEDGVNTGLLFLTVIVMGFASSVVVTFALMQLYKKKMHISKR